jgi:hypothetical protein
MTTGHRKVDLNIEEKLAQINLSPSERAQALSALRLSEDMVNLFGTLAAGVRRIAGVFSLRPSVRA